MSSDDHRALVRDYPSGELATLLQQATGIGLRFTTGDLRHGQVLRYATPGELIERFSAPIPETGAGTCELLSALEDIASWSISQADPRYLAFPDTGDSIAGLLADTVARFLNQNLIAFDRSGPAASVIEAQVISWLRQLIGYDTAPVGSGMRQLGGMWASGGNMSNHIAIAVALARAYPQIRQTGLSELPERPAILLASGVEHFSYLSAAQSLGLGANSLLWARPQADYTTDVDAIEQQLADPLAGTRIVMVVGVAGNCRTTGLDDLARLSRLCHRYDVWLHVDACHGGSLLFSDQLRGRLDGIERADSVSLDPHKGLFVTYPSSYVLFRDPDSLGRLSRYPDRSADPECLDLGLITPFYGSRGFDSLKLWALMQHQGRAGIAALVEARHRTFGQMSTMLRRTGYVRLLGGGDFYRCAFVFLPDAADNLFAHARRDPALHQALHKLVSSYTSRFCDRLYRRGSVVFDLFALADLGDSLGLGADRKYQAMGMCVGHPHIDTGTESEIEKALHEVGQQLTGQFIVDLSNLDPGSVAETSVAGPAGW